MDPDVRWTPWLEQQLAGAGVDVEVFAPYITSLLLDADTVREDVEEVLQSIDAAHLTSVCWEKWSWFKTAPPAADLGVKGDGEAPLDAVEDERGTPKGTPAPTTTDHACSMVGMVQEVVGETPLEEESRMAPANESMPPEELQTSLPYPPTTMSAEAPEFVVHDVYLSPHEAALASDPILQEQVSEVIAALEKCCTDENEVHQLLSRPVEDVSALLFMLMRRDEVDDYEPGTREAMSRTPCTFYLKGKCFRADCWYSHNLSDVKCKFFQAGHCAKGNQCEFRHDVVDLPLNTAVDVLRELLRDGLRITQDAEVEEVAAGSIHFPALDGDTPASTLPAPPNSESMANKLKFSMLEDRFPTLSTQQLREIWAANNMALDATISAVKRAFPAIHDQPPQPQRHPRPTIHPSHPVYGRKIVRPDAWVETGDAVGQLYASTRREAVSHAKQRNTCYARATHAYINGMKADATRLSREGRVHDRKMRELHAKAAAQIIAARNPNGIDSDVLDLHGLHITEATALLDVYLDAIYRQKRFKCCFVIVGTGHHSRHTHLPASAGQARLQKSIIQHLTEQGWT